MTDDTIEPGKPVKLSPDVIKRITEPGVYPDTEQTGFRLWVGRGDVKSYQLVGKVKRIDKTAPLPKPRYITIGRVGTLSLKQAREEAERLHLLMRQGIDPVKQAEDAAILKRAEEAQRLEEAKQAEAARKAVAAEKKLKEDFTLEVAFKEFLKAKKQKESTKYIYQTVFYKHFHKRFISTGRPSWLTRPLIEITEDDVLALYDEIDSESESEGASSAAHVMRILKAVIKTAQVNPLHRGIKAELLNLSPVGWLSHGRKEWNKVAEREDFISDDALPAFYKAVQRLDNEAAKDYLMVCILTGLRKGEVCGLRWSTDIDLQKKTPTITIQSARAKNKQHHVLIMSDYLYSLFLQRWQSREAGNDYVFPGRGADGHFCDPESQIAKVLDMAKIEPFTSHSLRRTFATAADALGYDLNEVQRLLNHKPVTVTEKHYIQKVAERTREPMQRICDYLLGLMGAETPQPEVNVVPLSASKNRRKGNSHD